MDERSLRKSAAHILIELDKNKDGKLNVDEVPEKLRERFGETDTNDDGYIDEGELTKGLDAVGKKIHEQVKQLHRGAPKPTRQIAISYRTSGLDSDTGGVGDQVTQSAGFHTRHRDAPASQLLSVAARFHAPPLHVSGGC